MPQRRAYYVDLTMATEGGFIPAVVTEGEPGYTPMSGNGAVARPWVWGPTLQDARRQATEANAELGLTEQDVQQILLSSFAAQND